MKKHILSAALKAAFPMTIPVMAGYIFLGISYGVLSRTNGFPIWLPVVTALIIYTGSMEFLMVSILASAFHPMAAFVTALMVGSRHLFYGLSMLHKYHGTGRKKFYLIYTTSDETFAVNYTAKLPAHVDKGWFYFWVSFLDQIYWVFGAFMGAVIGGLIPFETKGLDFVMTAMFLTIFIGQWVSDSKSSDSKSSSRTNSRESNESHSKYQPSVISSYLRKHLPEIIGVIGSLLSLVVFGPEKFILPAMGIILLALILARPILDDPPTPQNRKEES
jgi:4-azaleucine resistance transporter AzlC